MDEVFINIPSIELIGEELIGKFAEMGITVLTTTVNAISLRDMLAKRGIDIASGLVGSIITLILCIFIGPMIYIKSPGPIFFLLYRFMLDNRYIIKKIL